METQQSQNYYDDRFRRPQVQPAAIPSVQSTTAQALRSISSEMPNHRRLSARTLLSGNRKKRLPTTQETNTASQGSVVHRIGGLGVRFYQPTGLVICSNVSPIEILSRKHFQNFFDNHNITFTREITSLLCVIV